jgi:hypothetical protein
MPRLVLRDLDLGPSVNAIGFNARWLYALCRVVGAKALGNSELQESAQSLEPVACHRWRPFAERTDNEFPRQ